MCYAAGAINSHDANALTGTEYLVRLNLLHISTSAAVVFTNSDFNTLGFGQARFSSRPQQTTCNCTNHSCHDTAATATNGATAVASTPLSPHAVIAASASNGQLMLELDDGSSLAHSAVKAVY